MNPSAISADRLEHLRHLEAHLAEQIRGQDHVLPRVASVIHRGELVSRRNLARAAAFCS